MSIQLRDPVHNFISLRRDEVKLMDTIAMQRLRRISQLAMANLVYPGAMHTRFDHSVGVAHVAGLMAEELGLEKDDITLIRVAALLHDIGHGPFSHVSEQALEWYADRTTLDPAQKKEKIHELISARIIQKDKEIVNILGTSRCGEVVKLLSEGHGQPALRSIVSGPLDADKQDYLLRDSFFCGVPYGIFDIHQLHRSIALGGQTNEEQLMIKRDGIHAVEQYVLAKYYLTTLVYRHKVRLITDQMIIRAITLGIDKDQIEELRDLYHFDNTDDFVRRYLRWDDARFMHEFCVAAGKSKCKELLDRLRMRKLLKRVFWVKANRFSAETKDALHQLIKLDSKGLREKIEAAIAEKLAGLTGQEVDPDFVIVNVFSIRSVKETSRNNEAEILVLDHEPQPFEKASTLFASINERYADEYVEIYAPVEWETLTEKSRIREKVESPVLELIEEHYKAEEEGVEK